MCAELGGKLLAPALLLALLLASAPAAAGTEATHPPEGPQDRTPQQKGRLSLQNTGTGGGGTGLASACPPPLAAAAAAAAAAASSYDRRFISVSDCQA